MHCAAGWVGRRVLLLVLRVLLLVLRVLRSKLRGAALLRGAAARPAVLLLLLVQRTALLRGPAPVVEL